MKRLSIKARVTFWYTLLVALIALLAAGALFWSAQRMMDNYYEEALVGTTQLALNDVRMEDGQLEIDRNLDDLPSVRVSLYTQSGDLIYGKWRFDLPFEENVIRPAAERSGERWYVLDTRMSFPDAEDIWLRCYISADAAANLSDMSATLLLALLPALVVVAGVGGYFIARRAFRPVTRIARTAESIIDGKDLQKRIGLQGARDELYRLSKVFDDMLDRLEHSFERERRFTSDASHELRTPIAVIIAECEYARQNAKTVEDYQESMEVVERQSRKMSTLVNQLLNITRMDQGTHKISLERADFSELVEVVCDEAAVASGRDIRLEKDIEQGVYANMDVGLMARLVQNLVENAFKYTAEGGTVRVGLHTSGGRLTFSVSDTGIGIDKKDLPHIWERFWQADSSRGVDRGSGLGLAMVKQIADAHGGKLGVESSPGEGSTFSYSMDCSN